MNVLFVKYTNDRKEKYRIKTVIAEEKGKKIVYKEALNKLSIEHVHNIYLNREKLKAGNSPFNLVNSWFEDEKVFFDYVEGKTLDNIAINIFFNEGTDNFLKFLSDIRQKIDKDDNAVINLDLTLDNIIRKDNGELVVIDYEWISDVSENGIEKKFIFFRLLEVLYYKYKKYFENFFSFDELLKKFIIDEEMIEEFKKISIKFYSEKLDDNRIMSLKRHMYIEDKDFLQIFYDYGNGFDEKDYFIKEYNYNNEIDLEIEIRKDVKAIRIDPKNKKINLKIMKCIFLGKDGDTKEIKFNSNAVFNNENVYIFTTEDPQLYLDNLNEGKLIFSFKEVELSNILNNRTLYIEPKNVSDYISSYGKIENMIKKLDSSIEEKNNLIVEKSNLIEEKNNLIEEKNRLAIEKVNLIEEKNNLITEKNNLEEKKDTLKDEYKKFVQMVYNKTGRKFLNKLRQFYYIYYIYKSRVFNNQWYINEYNDFGKIYIDKIKKNQKLPKVLEKMYRVLNHPITHYVRYGTFEGRNPLYNFDEIEYLKNNKDVLLSGINPLYHFLRYGEKEGRRGYLKINTEKNEGKTSLNNDISKYQKNLDIEYINSLNPLVTVIVPNYNHEKYLVERLESIYNQTYSNFEVILLDDCSKDKSAEIMKMYLEKYPEKTRCVINEKNSGGTFYQWKKGIEMAKGKYIWIAESDDKCDLNFLEEVTKPLVNDGVLLSYSRTTFINSDGTEKVWEIEDYLREIDPILWENSFIMPANEIVSKAFCIKNIVPNASSCVFKNPVKSKIINEEIWYSMKICGDWLFYIDIMRGGLISYTNKTTNYFRMHQKNTSVSSYTKDFYYKEHEIVAKEIKKNYIVENSVFEKQEKVLKEQWIYVKKPDIENFSEDYDLNSILSIKKDKLTILMCGYAFSSGGGETFPIHLANMMSDLGHTVIFLSFDQTDRNIGVRDMLYPHIPVFNDYMQLNEITKKFDVDIIHSHHGWVESVISDIIDVCKLKVKHIVTLHGMYETIPKQHLLPLLEKLYPKVSSFVYIADKNLTPFEKYGYSVVDKFKKIGNAVSASKTEKVDLSEYGINSESFVISLVSRAIPEKGWEEAINIITNLRKISQRDVHLLLIGDGPECERLKEKESSYIHFLGFRSNVKDYFYSSDLAILPSKFKGESYPIVLIEALVSGIPVIASDIGEIRTMMTFDENDEVSGSIIKLKNWKINEKEWCDEILRFVQDKNYYNSKKKISQLVAEKFSPQKISVEYEEVFLNS